MGLWTVMGKAEPFILSTGFMSVTGATKPNRCYRNSKPTSLGKHKSFILSAIVFQPPTKKLAWVAQPSRATSNGAPLPCLPAGCLPRYVYQAPVLPLQDPVPWDHWKSGLFPGMPFSKLTLPQGGVTQMLKGHVWKQQQHSDQMLGVRNRNDNSLFQGQEFG